MQDSFLGYKKLIPDANQILFIAKVINSDEIKESETDVEKETELDKKLAVLKEDLQKFTDEKLELLAGAIMDKFNEGKEHKAYNGKFLQEQSKALKKSENDAKKMQRKKHETKAAKLST